MSRVLADNQATLGLFEETEIASVSRSKSAKAKEVRQGTFTDNMKLPIHRWIRYSAGFSAEWVEGIISSEFGDGKPVILDPFAGSGTTLIAAEKIGVRSIGFESHPFVYRLASAKINWDTVVVSDFLAAIDALISTAKTLEKNVDLSGAAPLLVKCYRPESLRSLFALKAALESLPKKDTPINDMLWLAITSVLRACSYVGTAQWQYVLPSKRKAITKKPYLALEVKAQDMADDLLVARRDAYSALAEIYLQDAREPSPVKTSTVDMVITSPPYPN